MSKFTKIASVLLAGAISTLAYAGDVDHEGDAEIGQWNGQVSVEFEQTEPVLLDESMGILSGWAGDEPGFLTVEQDEPAEELLLLDPATVLVLEVVSLDPALKAHTPGFADVLDTPGDTWTIGSAPFDDHPTWHIDSTDPGFDPDQSEWTGVFRIIDTGTTGLLPSDPFTIVFTNGEEEHGHEDDAELGQWNGQVSVEFDSSEVFSLAETSGILTGWAGDEPGFLTVEEDEPMEELLVFDPATILALEVVSIDPALKAHTPGFVDVLDAPGDTWTIGAAPFDDHPIWHIDSTDPGFDPAQTEWTAVFRVIDVGTTGLAPSEPFAMTFTNLPPEESFVRGDTNADGMRNIADAMFALDALFLGGPMGECEDANDANDDGFFDVADPVAILNSLFGSSTIALPGPGPVCGDDSTADNLSCEEHDACL